MTATLRWPSVFATYSPKGWEGWLDAQPVRMTQRYFWRCVRSSAAVTVKSAGTLYSSTLGAIAYPMCPNRTPATSCTRSCSTTLRNFVTAASGRPWLSSTISSTLRPAICEPISSRYIVMPLTMSLAACAAGPVRSVMNPILIGPDCAGVPPTAPRRSATRTSSAIAKLRGPMGVPPALLRTVSRSGGAAAGVPTRGPCFGYRVGPAGSRCSCTGAPYCRCACPNGAALPPPRPGHKRLVLDEGLEVAPAQRMTQLAERLGLDLPDALTGNREALADFFQRVLALLTDAEPEAKDLLLLRRQRGQRALDLRREVLTQQRGVRRARRLVFEEVAQLAVLADRRLQRPRLARRLENQSHLLGRHTSALRQLLRRGLPAHLVDHVAVDPRDAVERLDHVHRDPDRARVVRDGARDGLTDPPRRVGRELEPAPVLEPVDGLHEADVALLDQVEQRQVAAEVALGHRDDEAQVGLHQLALGLTHRAVACLGLGQQRLQLLARQPRLRLEPLELLRQRGGPVAARLLSERVDPLAEPSHLADEIVDQRRLQRHVGDRLLDAGAMGRDLLLDVGPSCGGSALVAQRLLEPRDFALQAADAAERQEHGADLLGLQLAALGQHDHVVGGDVVVPEPIAHLEQGADGHRDAREPAAQRDLPNLDPSADLDLLLRG